MAAAAGGAARAPAPSLWRPSRNDILDEARAARTGGERALAGCDDETNREPSFVVATQGLTAKRRGRDRAGRLERAAGAGDGIRTHDIQLGKLALYP